VAIADDDPVNEWNKEIVEPRGLGPFLEGDVDRASHLAEELGQSPGLGRDDGPGDHPPVSAPTEARVVA
jgi:hypothetical protein